MNKSDIFKLIPADSLHWNEIQKEYVALSDLEIDAVILDCVENAGISDPETIHKVLQNFTDMKVSSLLFKQYMDGNIGIGLLTELGEVGFVPLS